MKLFIKEQTNQWIQMPKIISNFIFRGHHRSIIEIAPHISRFGSEILTNVCKQHWTGNGFATRKWKFQPQYNAHYVIEVKVK